jgi:hypothetical protein
MSRFTPTPEMKVFFGTGNFVLFMIFMIIAKAMESHISIMQGIIWSGLVLLFKMDDNKALLVALVSAVLLYFLFSYLGLV